MKKSGLDNKFSNRFSWLITLLLVNVVFQLNGQAYHNSIIVTDSEGCSSEFKILYISHTIRPDKDICYYWYKNGHLKSNYGSFSGNLLQGMFEKYDSKGNLIENGNFLYGAKDGHWTCWDAKGRIIRNEFWSSGYLKVRTTYSGDTIIVEPFRKMMLHGKKMITVHQHLVETQKYKNGQLIKPKKLRIFSLLSGKNQIRNKSGKIPEIEKKTSHN